MKKLLVTVSLLLAASLASAEDQLRLHPGMTGVIDIGVANCTLFSEMHYNGPTGMRHHVLTWVQGYVFAKTGSNIEAMLEAMPDGNGWDFDSLSGVFVEYCEANPDAQVAEAAIALWSELSEGNSAPL